jgi:very-short-patch-repair endonuclease
MAIDSLLAARLEAARHELLDLGMRNPLLNFRPSPTRGVAVVREQSALVYEVLVRQGKTMYFQGAPGSSKTIKSSEHVQFMSGFTDLEADAANFSAAEAQAQHDDYHKAATKPVPMPAELTESERAALLTDNKLQTDDPVDKLERRLLNTYYTARTSLEEQGVNILYLALGQLVWFESESSPEARRAPLILVPVLLERGTAAERFKLRHTGAETESNLSLQAKLKASFGVLLPPLDEEVPITEYYTTVSATVAGMSRWQVETDSIALGFFSFGKFMLYHDLDPATWPAGTALLDHPAITALLGPDTGFQEAAPTLNETTFLDTDSPAHDLHQVLDADSSQLLALLAVHEGRNLVVQGPPGTGKSQTIANLLAEAIGAGKKVLFVAEKMAALEVVKRRLDNLGLGAACLELHSHKANKKALHDELKHTLSLGRPATTASVTDQVAQLPRYRATLNAYALAVNAALGHSRRTAQQVAGELLALNEKRGPVELPRLAFSNLSSWTDTDAAHAETLAAQVQATLQKIGKPSALLFWGSELTVLLPATQAALAEQLTQAQQAIDNLVTVSTKLAQHLGLPLPTERAAAEVLLPAARHAQLAPTLCNLVVQDSAWLTHANQLADTMQAGAAYVRLRQQYEATVLPEAWAQQLLPERAAFLSYGTKWWNFLSGDYRRAKKRLQSLWRNPLPTEPSAVLHTIDAILEATRQEQLLASASNLMASLFGPAWQGVRSDWVALEKAQHYLTLTHQRISRNELPGGLLTYLAQNPNLEELTVLLTALEDALTQHRAAVQVVVDGLQLNEVRRFGPEGRLQFQPFAQQRSMVAAWAADLPALRLTTEWNNVAATVQADGLTEMLLLAERWEPAAHHLVASVRQTWLEFLQKLAYEQHPALRQFERASHEENATRFRQADQDSLYYNRVRAMQQHFEQLPSQLASGQMLVLRNEFAKKARNLPLRKLMQQAGRAVQAIKPVFMMSPLSVASYLPPGAVEFDLVVFDEASQVKPVEALGAIARGRQLVVVGDSKQLPPTSFFDSLTGTGEDIHEDNVTADIQSILELCKARQMPERMLRWHYRSQHQSLIAASNHLFYHDKLVVFPSPGGQGELGLVYHHMPATYYERGTTRTNPLEAQAVAEAVLHHARTTPHRTLGVVAFSTGQRQAIQDALERLRRQHPETEAFFSTHSHEPFFVKNLENVQGDERDVILISIGYGRTQEGYLAMSFGPLNGEGGERRLNVLITRAKQRCEVFTNLTAVDLDLTRTSAKGVDALKTFLEFAEHGRLYVNQETERAMESPFEEAVHRALTARGYVVRPQVGSQGFYLDLAVVDPDQPGRYVLGIECDGAMYHSARSARDRDRLRQQVLENVGWRLHRIWSTDWFRNPAAETERAVQAIEQARHSATRNTTDALEMAATTPEAPVGITREGFSAGSTALAESYQVAQLPAAIRNRELHQHNLGQLAGWLTQIVRIESPIHIEEATRRLAQASGATQVGARIRKTVQGAALLALNLRHLRRQGDFLWENTMQQPPLRDRSQLSASSRKLPLVAPEELARALRTVVEQSFTLPRDAVFLPAVRLLGFSRLSEEMRQHLEPILADLLEKGELEDTNGILKPAN